jgi:hypothetical protein
MKKLLTFVLGGKGRKKETILKTRSIVKSNPIVYDEL